MVGDSACLIAWDARDILLFTHVHCPSEEKQRKFIRSRNSGKPFCAKSSQITEESIWWGKGLENCLVRVRCTGAAEQQQLGHKAKSLGKKAVRLYIVEWQQQAFQVPSQGKEGWKKEETFGGAALSLFVLNGEVGEILFFMPFKRSG